MKELNKQNLRKQEWTQWEINMKTFKEARGDTAVFTFGRFNPPTTGHEKLINALAKQASSGQPMYVYPSHSQNPKKDPLPHNKKVAYMRAMFPQYRRNIVVSKSRNVFDIAVELYKKGHKAIIMVVGSDRVQEFANLLDKYNGVEGRHGYYGFDNIEVVSAGERDPDAEGVTGMSASKMRAAAQADDYEQFKLGLPKGFKQGEKLFKDVRSFMGLKEEYNLTLEELNRDLYIRGEIWNVGDVVKTTDGDEGTIIRKGTNYVVFEDLRKVWLHNLEEVKQDKDIKDREGTQPAKYYAKDADGDEMSVATKKARARHFEKGKKGPAPGDADAETKPSKHTKKFKQMYGENENPCWDTHKQVGMKKKNGKMVPNCVPKEEVIIEAEMKCPPATQDVAMNTKNRNSTIKNHMYGPLNVDEPGDYWEKIADKWDTTVDAAKKSLCGNCVAFDISPRMEDCMPGPVSDDDGRLGYCWMHHFKCHSARTCDTWAKGGPIKDDKISYEWQDRANMNERALTDAEKEKMKEYEKKIDKKDFIDRYGKEEGESVYYATITKMAKGEEVEVDEKTYLKRDKKLPNLMVPKKGKAGVTKFQRHKKLASMGDEVELDEKIAALVKKAEKSGMPYGILKKVYDRGMAAYKTGHRPGATAQQWALARVNSFTTKSKGTWGKADADLARQVRGEYYEIGKDYADHTRKVTPGQKATKESVDEWYNSKTIREQYENRYGEDWFIKLRETYEKMLSKLPCCEDCAEGHLIEENQYRVGSEKYYEFFQEKRQAYRKGELELSGFDKELMEGDIGKFAWYEGNPVPLDCPMIAEAEYDGKKVDLNKPKKGGSKKYYVYVKDPSTGKVKKVSWGDTTGLKVKLDDEEARKSFAARHDCENKKDKTTAGYWACNLPRYAKQLGLSGGGNFFW